MVVSRSELDGRSIQENDRLRSTDANSKYYEQYFWRDHVKVKRIWYRF